MAKETTRAASERQTASRPAGIVNPARPAERVFTFSFSSGRHPRIRRFIERIETALSRTVYRPFMRFLPPTVDRVALPFSNPALSGVTMAQLSDLHHSQIVPLSVIEQAVALVNSLKPDVIFLTGDYVTNDASYAPACARVLGGLRAPLGVYAILGNHDYWTNPDEIAEQLRASGIPVLMNEARQLAEDVWVVGMDDIWSGKPDLDKAMAAVPAGVTTILLAHEPDFADQAQGRGISLQLSGHSHGGQVRVPFTRRPILPSLTWKYYVGLQAVGDLWVYTNKGVGTMQPPLVFTCGPEVALLQLAARVCLQSAVA